MVTIEIKPNFNHKFNSTSNKKNNQVKMNFTVHSVILLTIDTATFFPSVYEYFLLLLSFAIY